MSAAHPELYAHTSLGPWASADEFVLEWIEKVSHQNLGYLTYAIIDKTKPSSPEDDEGELAGMVSYMDSSTTALTTEIGGIVVLPQYQKTHVATNAVGLLMQHALDRPEDGGLGLSRLQWHTSTANAVSTRVAERLGFQYEGTLRWHKIFPQGAKRGKVGNGRALPPGSHTDDLWRDTVVLSMCWEDWDDAKKAHLQALMNRTK